MAGATHSFWIGLNDRDSAGRYYWSDDSAVPYTAWDAGNPTDTQSEKPRTASYEVRYANPAPRKYAFLQCGHRDFESAVIG